MRNAAEPSQIAAPTKELVMQTSRSAQYRSVLGMRVDEFNYDSAVSKLGAWADGGSRYVCCSTVHMVMESYDSPRFKNYVNNADMVVADGVPIVWITRKLGLGHQVRVDAPTLTLKLCEMAEKEKISVGFYGSTPVVIRDLVHAISSRYPSLKISYSYSPPFRPLSAEEDETIVENINRSGVRILFVGLGCPKQEKWMFEHKGRVPATMLGVGWAFDVLSGHSMMAPRWIQNSGMEWFYRLVQNPKKLWKRHLKHNPRFLVFAFQQLCNIRNFPLGPTI
jgi:N-acetylglucosaminyldiphosphoundecaprenol N-acetyl-beta-D-mannosaminyltransferase